MHPAVREFVARWASDAPLDILDIGGRDVNGTVHDLFPAARITVLDPIPAKDVDVVADAADWEPDRAYDLVVCTEVFEHTARWRDICVTAFRALKPGGVFVVTCAGPGRGAHSGIRDGRPYPHEHYENIDSESLRDCLTAIGFRHVESRRVGLDVQATALRGD